MKITFKNVGQGDSIILEWKNDQNEDCIGIIDCNIYQGENPVLNHLIYSEYRKIEFIILTHPHFDHFSGMQDLIKFCQKKRIFIKIFLYTLSAERYVLLTPLLSATKAEMLLSLLEEIHRLNKSGDGVISEIANVRDNNKDLDLNKEYKLAFLAPSYSDYRYFSTKANEFKPRSNVSMHLANHISTVLSIRSEKGYALLTSDASLRILKRLQKNIETNTPGKILLGQAPHHGSIKNHLNSFWSPRKKQEYAPIVFSVGSTRYKHPDIKVVKFFSERGYEIYSTNMVNGINEYLTQSSIPYPAKTPENRAVLDFGSTLVHRRERENPKLSQYSGDQIFEL